MAEEEIGFLPSGGPVAMFPEKEPELKSATKDNPGLPDIGVNGLEALTDEELEEKSKNGEITPETLSTYSLKLKARKRPNELSNAEAFRATEQGFMHPQEYTAYVAGKARDAEEKLALSLARKYEFGPTPRSYDVPPLFGEDPNLIFNELGRATTSAFLKAGEELFLTAVEAAKTIEAPPTPVPVTVAPGVVERPTEERIAEVREQQERVKNTYDEWVTDLGMDHAQFEEALVELGFQPKTGLGQFVSSTMQFMGGFLMFRGALGRVPLAGKTGRALDSWSRGLRGVHLKQLFTKEGMTVLGQKLTAEAALGAPSGALADLTVAPSDSNINDFFQEFAVLRPFVVEALTSDEDDTVLETKLKNAATGVLAGPITGTAFTFLEAMGRGFARTVLAVKTRANTKRLAQEALADPDRLEIRQKQKIKTASNFARVTKEARRGQASEFARSLGWAEPKPVTPRDAQFSASVSMAREEIGWAAAEASATKDAPLRVIASQLATTLKGAKPEELPDKVFSMLADIEGSDLTFSPQATILRRIGRQLEQTFPDQASVRNSKLKRLGRLDIDPELNLSEVSQTSDNALWSKEEMRSLAPSKARIAVEHQQVASELERLERGFDSPAMRPNEKRLGALLIKAIGETQVLRGRSKSLVEFLRSVQPAILPEDILNAGGLFTADGRNLVIALARGSSFKTLLHETGHLWRAMLSADELQVLQKHYGKTFLPSARVRPEGTVLQLEESAAEQFLDLSTGLRRSVGNSQVDAIFNRIASIIRRVTFAYVNDAGVDVMLHPRTLDVARSFFAPVQTPIPGHFLTDHARATSMLEEAAKRMDTTSSELLKDDRIKGAYDELLGLLEPDKLESKTASFEKLLGKRVGKATGQKWRPNDYLVVRITNLPQIVRALKGTLDERRLEVEDLKLKIGALTERLRKAKRQGQQAESEILSQELSNAKQALQTAINSVQEAESPLKGLRKLTRLSKDTDSKIEKLYDDLVAAQEKGDEAEVNRLIEEIEAAQDATPQPTKADSEVKVDAVSEEDALMERLARMAEDPNTTPEQLREAEKLIDDMTGLTEASKTRVSFDDFSDKVAKKMKETKLVEAPEPLRFDFEEAKKFLDDDIREAREAGRSEEDLKKMWDEGIARLTKLKELEDAAEEARKGNLPPEQLQELENKIDRVKRGKDIEEKAEAPPKSDAEPAEPKPEPLTWRKAPNEDLPAFIKRIAQNIVDLRAGRLPESKARLDAVRGNLDNMMDEDIDRMILAVLEHSWLKESELLTKTEDQETVRFLANTLSLSGDGRELLQEVWDMVVPDAPHIRAGVLALRDVIHTRTEVLRELATALNEVPEITLPAAARFYRFQDDLAMDHLQLVAIKQEIARTMASLGIDTKVQQEFQTKLISDFGEKLDIAMQAESFAEENTLYKAMTEGNDVQAQEGVNRLLRKVRRKKRMLEAKKEKIPMQDALRRAESGDKEALEAVKKFVEERGGINRAKSLAKEIAESPDPIKEAAKAAKRSRVKEVMTDVMYNGMLSNFTSTPIRAMAGTSSQIFIRDFGMILQAGANLVLRNPDLATMEEVTTRFVAGLKSNFQLARMLGEYRRMRASGDAPGMQALFEQFNIDPLNSRIDNRGMSFRDAVDAIDIEKLPDSAQRVGFGAKGLLKLYTRFAGMGVDALRFVDQVMTFELFQRELAGKAVREANNRGLTGFEKKAFIEDYVHNLGQRDFEDEALNILAEKARRNEIDLSDAQLEETVKEIVARKSKDLKEEALREVRRSTLQTPLGGNGGRRKILGLPLRQVEQVFQQWFPLRLLMPFTKTMVNSFEESLRATPIGAWAVKEVSDDLKGLRGQRVRADRMSEIAAGSIIGGTFAALGLMGLANGTSFTKTQREFNKIRGVKDDSLFLGTTADGEDIWFNYGTFEPLASVIRLWVDAAQVAKLNIAFEDVLTQDEESTLISQLMFVTWKAMTDRSFAGPFVEFVDTFFDGAMRPEEKKVRLERLGGEFASTFTPPGLSSLSGATQRGLDPFERDIRTFYDAIGNKVNRGGLRLRRDIFGRPIKNRSMYNGFFTITDPIESFEVEQEMKRLRVPFSAISDVIDGVSLEPAEHNELLSYLDDPETKLGENLVRNIIQSKVKREKLGPELLAKIAEAKSLYEVLDMVIQSEAYNNDAKYYEVTRAAVSKIQEAQENLAGLVAQTDDDIALSLAESKAELLKWLIGESWEVARDRFRTKEGFLTRRNVAQARQEQVLLRAIQSE